MDNILSRKIHQTFGKRSYIEILETKQFTRKFRRPFQNIKSFYLNFKGFKVFCNFSRFHHENIKLY